MLHLLLTVMLLLSAVDASASLQNRLLDHPSPYLAMHGQDPVHWQLWGEDALERARTENKLLFVSSGYFACHWCHVMQRESYRDPRVAALLNAHFIPVKVDRELEPALDDHLIGFVQRTRGSAGWPLNVFLTPEGFPLIGLTYSPTQSFLGLLQKLEQAWSEKSPELKQMAQQAVQAVDPQPGNAQVMVQVDRQALGSALVRMALDVGDDMEGGFGRQNRFPMASQWSVLLENLEQAPDGSLRELVRLTLDQMASQGLRDHLGGGFFRYTIDPGWQVPHYEKMLYTQALLARLYLQAADVMERPDYRDVARDTLDFTLRVMSGESGGFIASLSAVDASGAEGAGYLWRASQLEQVLDPQELAFARLRWRLPDAAAGEEAFLPLAGASLEEIARQGGQTLPALRSLEQRVRDKLLQARASRSHPRDTKQLAAWNGLMLSALVDGARQLQAPAYRLAAARLRDYLVKQLWDGKQLLRARGSRGALGSAALEDYVYVAAGIRDWAELSGSAADMALVHKLTQQAWERFFQPGGWKTTDRLLIPGMAVQPVIADGPLPSPAALLTGLSLQLEDTAALRPLIRQAISISYPETRRQPLWHATHARLLIGVQEE